MQSSPVFGKKPVVCKSDGLSVGSNSQIPICPKGCGVRVWRDGYWSFVPGECIQRWVCRECGYRFSDPLDLQRSREALQEVQRVATMELKSPNAIDSSCQISVQKETKNLVAEQKQTEVLRRRNTGDLKPKILEFALWLKHSGKSEATIRGRVKLLNRLIKRGANLYDPESFKKKIAEQEWSNGQKNNAVDAYSSFLKMEGGKWDPPAYKTIRKIPFIPKEAEIDQLIAGSSIRMATFLQLLKETGARCGEIWQLQWSDVDFESKVVNVTPEKGSNPRVTRLSIKLLEMLEHLPKKYGDRVFSFPNMRVDNFAVNFQRQRKRTAKKIQNPRLLKIHFHTLRYWKGTMLYHQTKDMFYVMQRLGHKNIKNTLLYVQLEEALFDGADEYISKVARNEKEICVLIESGFEFVTDFEGAKIFKKRK